MNVAISEYRPSEGLQPFVQSYWQGHFNLSDAPNYVQSVVPNGCIELIIHLSNDHCSLSRSEEYWSRSPDFTLLGLYTQPYEVQFVTEVRVFGIRFYPDGIRQIFGVPPVDFLATYEDGVTVLGQSLKAFCSRIRDLQHTAAQVALADEYIRQQLEFHYQSYDYTHMAMSLIRKVAGLSN